MGNLIKKIGLLISLFATIGLVMGIEISEFKIDHMAVPSASEYINISSNADLTKYEGSGTVEDPYIIKDIVIINHTGNGIVISNTNAHILIKNCTIENPNGKYNRRFSKGVYIKNAENIQINDCRLNGSEIFLENVETCQIKRSPAPITVSNESRSLGLSNLKSQDCLIEGCKINNGGLAFFEATNFIIKDCYLENGPIIMEHPINFTFSNVTLLNSSLDIFSPSNVSFTGVNLIEPKINLIFGLDRYPLEIKNSTVNGLNIYYYKNEHGLKIKNLKAGYIWLANCTKAELNQTESLGIFLLRSNNSVIENSKVNEVGHGILLSLSENCIIENVSLPNSRKGITIGYGSDNTTLNQSFIKSETIGVNIYSNRNKITNNLITDSYIGISLFGSNSTIMQNTLINNSIGIDAKASNNIEHNNLSYNLIDVKRDGIGMNNHIGLEDNIS